MRASCEAEIQRLRTRRTASTGRSVRWISSWDLDNLDPDPSSDTGHRVAQRIVDNAHLMIHLGHHSIGPKGGPIFDMTPDAPSLWLVHHLGPHDTLAHEAVLLAGPGLHPGW